MLTFTRSTSDDCDWLMRGIGPVDNCVVSVQRELGPTPQAPSQLKIASRYCRAASAVRCATSRSYAVRKPSRAVTEQPRGEVGEWMIRRFRQIRISLTCTYARHLLKAFTAIDPGCCKMKKNSLQPATATDAMSHGREFYESIHGTGGRWPTLWNRIG